MRLGKCPLLVPYLGYTRAQQLRPIYRAIQNGANNLAEIFLFGVAATLILGET